MIDLISTALNLQPLSHFEIMLIKNSYTVDLNHQHPDKIQAWNKGLATGPRIEEDRLKISSTLMGHYTSEETKHKIAKKIKINNELGINGFSLGHAVGAGKKGGLSKSDSKINAVLTNQKKSLETIRGSIWMINRKTTVRKRVPQHLINEYESLGFIKGSK